MGPDDRDLMDAINEQADRAAENPAQQLDLKAMATTLGSRFEHRRVEEIEEKLRDVWRHRGLFWKT